MFFITHFFSTNVMVASTKLFTSISEILFQQLNPLVEVPSICTADCLSQFLLIFGAEVYNSSFKQLQKRSQCVLQKPAFRLIYNKRPRGLNVHAFAVIIKCELNNKPGSEIKRKWCTNFFFLKEKENLNCHD